jgi:AraC-like DNA-binding protein
MPEIYKNLSLSLLYIGFKRVENWWNFTDVISPFYRLYYIKSGKGTVYINEKPYHLAAGELFLIPKYTFHSYECSDFMEHYYICFFDDMRDEAGILNPHNLNLQVQASTLDAALIQKIVELNQNKSLPMSNPKYYDNDRVIYTNSKTVTDSQFASSIESDGILLQLFSRFITESCVSNRIVNNCYEKLDIVINHINKNLNSRISIASLADLMCITPDHFSKVFKKIMGMSPSEYVQMKRIERAQTLLLTSQLSILEIAEKVGINNLSQFSHLFSKLTRCSPRAYRLMQFGKRTPHPHVNNDTEI